MFDGDRHLEHAAKDLRRTLGECLVEGTGGTLTLTGDGAVTLRRFGEVKARVILAARDWPGFAGDCVHALQTHVVHGLLHGLEFENSAEDYLPVLRLEDAVYRSAEEGRKIHV